MEYKHNDILSRIRQYQNDPEQKFINKNRSKKFQISDLRKKLFGDTNESTLRKGS
jgi:hypothetical protein